jgi:hypothetical protein
MTNKEIFQELKKGRIDKRRKLKAVKYLKIEVNRKLVFGISEEDGFRKLDEATRVDLLRQLEALEINEATVRGNKFNSKEYKFEPSRNYKFK